MTAIEAWLIACIVFVFAALVEYTGILLKMKMRKLTGTKRKKDNYAITDLAFFVIFPILFIIFNVLYWSSIVWNRQALDKVSYNYLFGLRMEEQQKLDGSRWCQAKAQWDLT